MTDTSELISIITGDPIDPADGYVTDAEGNAYTLDEYSIAVDVATGPEGDLVAPEPEPAPKAKSAKTRD